MTNDDNDDDDNNNQSEKFTTNVPAKRNLFMFHQKTVRAEHDIHNATNVN
jgi:hypothetical protein